MALFNSGDNEQKQRKKQAEKILDELVGGMMPTRTRIAFFSLEVCLLQKDAIKL
ncbi:MAG: hypothetical protein ACLU4F_06115 [Methanobrevibacter smithii]